MKFVRFAVVMWLSTDGVVHAADLGERLQQLLNTGDADQVLSGLLSSAEVREPSRRIAVASMRHNRLDRSLIQQLRLSGPVRELTQEIAEFAASDTQLRRIYFTEGQLMMWRPSLLRLQASLVPLKLRSDGVGMLAQLVGQASRGIWHERAKLLSALQEHFRAESGTKTKAQLLRGLMLELPEKVAAHHRELPALANVDMYQARGSVLESINAVLPRHRPRRGRSGRRAAARRKELVQMHGGKLAPALESAVTGPLGGKPTELSLHAIAETAGGPAHDVLFSAWHDGRRSAWLARVVDLGAQTPEIRDVRQEQRQPKRFGLGRRLLTQIRSK